MIFINSAILRYYYDYENTDYTSWFSRKLLKTLLDSLTNDSKKMQVEVLQTLIDMLKCPELVDSFSVYPELLVLKVINAYKLDDQKQDSSTSSNSRSPVSL